VTFAPKAAAWSIRCSFNRRTPRRCVGIVHNRAHSAHAYVQTRVLSTRQYPATAPSPRYTGEGTSLSDPYPHDAIFLWRAASPQALHLPRLHYLQPLPLCTGFAHLRPPTLSYWNRLFLIDASRALSLRVALKRASACFHSASTDRGNLRG